MRNRAIVLGARERGDVLDCPAGRHQAVAEDDPDSPGLLLAPPLAAAADAVVLRGAEVLFIEKIEMHDSCLSGRVGLSRKKMEFSLHLIVTGSIIA